MSQLKKFISVKRIDFNTQSTNTRSRSISNNNLQRPRSQSKQTPVVKKLHLEVQKTPTSKAVSKLGKIKIDLGNKTTSRSNISSTSKTRSNSHSKEEAYPKVLPDFGRLETELLDCNDFLLQLPDIAFPAPEDVTHERLILANRISHTIRTKKRIPPTTPEFYKLCYVIGRGAFAKVCLGIQILTGAKVAMKIIEKSSLKTESAKKRIIQEITIMKTLQNYKNTIQLYEVFETKKQIYLIMEYIEGGDLMKYTKEKPIPEQQAKNIFAQIVIALQMLQNHNILHRDIKLDNILLQGETIKLCDYGVSRLVIKGQKVLEQCGTPAYLAPEIISSKTGYEGFASDIWSCGVLLYILLVGKVPFKGSSMSELNQQIQNGLLNFMEMKKANLSNEAVDILKCMLTTNPKLRISLQEIVNHSWLREVQMKQFQKQTSTNFDLRIINHVFILIIFFKIKKIKIEQFGYQREFVLKSLQKKEQIKRLEIAEAEQLRAKYEKLHPKFSLFDSGFQLLKWKFFKIGLGLGLVMFSYQIYQTVDIYYNQGLQILPLQQKYEQPLADLAVKAITLEEEFLKTQIQGYDAIVLNHNYLIFNLLPNNKIITSQQYRDLNEEQIQELIKLCQFHNQNRTNCKNLHLKYAKELTIMRLKGFSSKYSFFTTVNQLLLAKQFFFLTVQEDQEHQSNLIRQIVNDEKSGKYSFIDQHPYI